MRGSIFVPEAFTDGAPTSCLVIAKGNDASEIINVNDIVLCQVGLGSRHDHIDETKKFWCRQEDIYAVLKGNKIYPIGRKILIRRDVEDKYEGAIVIPGTRRYQSLLGTVERIGISRTPMRVAGIAVGMKIHLTEWMEHMIPVELEDGGHGLIVNDTDLLYKVEE